MISERQVAKSFQALWAEAVPLLTPSFVHLFNVTYRKPLLDSCGMPCEPVKVIQGNNHTLVAEFAFQFVRIVKERSIGFADAILNTDLLQEVESEAVRLVKEFDGQIAGKVAATESERSEAVELIQNYWAFFDTIDIAAVSFYPPIKGAGFVDSCYGDIGYGDTLIEVKTVNRNISGRDLRQLLVYFALDSATAAPRWMKAMFLNPRRACFYDFSMEEVLRSVAGGRDSKEVFDDIIDYFSNREIIIDSAF